jgi:short-subunit dehydrogenase
VFVARERGGAVNDSGKLAVVTGASAGIGAAFARALSDRGHRVVLVGRDRGRLDAVAATLPGPSEVVVADLAQEDGIRAVEAVLRAEPVDLLVNNAGVGTYGPFTEQEPHTLDETVAVNAGAVVRLSRAALGPMVDRRGGGVITVSSLAGAAPQPGMATYSATKAFVDSWSRSVRQELHGSGVTLTSVQPGWVRTEFHARAGQAVGTVGEDEWLDPADVVARALDAHARGRGSVVVLPPVSPPKAAVRAARRQLGRVSWLRDLRRSIG